MRVNNQISEMSQFLKQRDIRPSLARINIYQYLIEKKNHPSVDMIYAHLSASMPTLSRTTVYNSLNLFLKKEVVQLIGIEDNEARYDAELSLHGHFKCTRCHCIYDFSIEPVNLKDNLNPSFEVNRKQLFYYGQCDCC